jgi:hypothetical protein
MACRGFDVLTTDDANTDTAVNVNDCKVRLHEMARHLDGELLVVSGNWREERGEAKATGASGRKPKIIFRLDLNSMLLCRQYYIIMYNARMLYFISRHININRVNI